MRAFGGLPAGLRAVLAVAATSLLMVVVAWATLIGPDQVFTGPGVVERTPTTTTRTCLPLVVTTAPDGTVGTTVPDNPQGLPLCEEPDTSRQDAIDLVEQADPPLWLKVLVWAFLLAVLVAVIALVVWVVANLVRGRRSSTRERREAVGFTTLGEPARLVEAITADAAQQDSALRDGDPRNAIVAAWLRFEVQGEAAGVGRRSWETSSEYALRVLDLVSADTGAVNRLAGLYREAQVQRAPDHRAAPHRRARGADRDPPRPRGAAVRATLEGRPGGLAQPDAPRRARRGGRLRRGRAAALRPPARAVRRDGCRRARPRLARAGHRRRSRRRVGAAHPARRRPGGRGRPPTCACCPATSRPGSPRRRCAIASSPWPAPATPVLADDLHRELDPLRRLSPGEIDRILTRIEEVRD